MRRKLAKLLLTLMVLALGFLTSASAQEPKCGAKWGPIAAVTSLANPTAANSRSLKRALKAPSLSPNGKATVDSPEKRKGPFGRTEKPTLATFGNLPIERLQPLPKFTQDSGHSPGVKGIFRVNAKTIHKIKPSGLNGFLLARRE